MESLIEQIYNGEYYPAEDLLPTSEAYREAKRRHTEYVDELHQTLTEKQREMREQAVRVESDIITMENQCIYAAGVRFGIQLMLEVFPMPEFDWESLQMKKEK